MGNTKKKSKNNIPEESSMKNFAELMEIDESQPFEKNVWIILKNLQETIIFISKQFDDSLLELKTIKEENIMLKKNQEFQHSTIKNLIVKCEELEFKINEFEQEKLNNFVNINGLPNLNLDDTKKAIIEVAKEFDINMNTNDIINVNKLQNKKAKTVDYNVEFKNEFLKKSMMQKRKEKQIFINSANEILSEDAETTVRANRSKKRVYINNHLTHFNFNTFKHAKLLLKNGWKYVWFKFGKIFVKKNRQQQYYYYPVNTYGKRIN